MALGDVGIWHFWNISNSIPEAYGISIKGVIFLPQQEEVPQEGKAGGVCVTSIVARWEGSLLTNFYSLILTEYPAQRNFTWE